MLLGKDRKPFLQKFCEGRSTVQGRPQHTVEVMRNLLHEFDGQGCLADASHAQHSHEATLIDQQPALQFGQLVRPAVQGRHVNRFTPVSAGQTRGRRQSRLFG